MDVGLVILSVVRTFGSFLLVCLAFGIAYVITQQVRERNKWYDTRLGKLASFGNCCLAIGLVGLVMYSGYGTHVEDSDPLFGGGEIVVDFEPTEKERIEHAVAVSLKLLIPALVGVYFGQHKNSKVR